MDQACVRKSLKHITGIEILFLAGFFFFGLFKEYAACIYAGVLCSFFYVTSRRKEIRIFIGAESFLIFIMVLMYFFTAFWGIDAGMSVIGAVRMTGVFVFALISMQQNESEQKKLFLCIPTAGAAMALIGAAAFPFPALRGFFWTDSRRLGGFFQYPNVFALFCLLGVLVLAEKKEDTDKKKRINFACMLLLFFGILLSGSRSVFFLTAGTAVFIMVFDKRNRKKLAALFLISVIFAAVYVTLSGDVQNIGRFFTSSFSSGTLLGRWMYAQDALKLVFGRPFGLGYLGYYYMEPKIQTAVYSVRFVHNDILQIALDIGIVPCLFFVIVLVKNIFSKKYSFYKRLMLAVMGIHLFFDFDLEFISVWCLLVLLLIPGRGKEKKICLEGRKKAVFGTVLACGLISFYFGFAMLPRYLGSPKLSLLALPFYTEAGKETLAAEEDMNEAAGLADKLIAQNTYIAEAFDIKAVDAYKKQMYGKMLSYKKQSLMLQKYDMDAYERYLALLGQALQDAADAKDEEAVMDILSSIAEIPEILEDVKVRTNPLAYQTRDIPVFELSSQAIDYIAQVKGILEEN